VDEQARQLQDGGAVSGRLAHENQELHRQLLDVDTANAALSKNKAALQQELQEMKARLDDETRVPTGRCLHSSLFGEGI